MWYVFKATNSYGEEIYIQANYDASDELDSQGFELDGTSEDKMPSWLADTWTS